MTDAEAQGSLEYENVVNVRLISDHPIYNHLIGPHLLQTSSPHTSNGLIHSRRSGRSQ